MAAAAPHVIALTQALLRHDTINPPGRERDCAYHVGGLLEAAGYRVAYHEFDDQRTCVVARIGGADDQPPLCLTGHLDTVPLGTLPWAHDPFAGETDGDKLYGRGSTDMKAGVAAIVVVAIELAPHLHRGPGLEIVLTAGEEQGCKGSAFLAASAGALGRAGAILVAEPTANKPYVGHKGIFKFHARTSGIAAHASRPHLGDNAIHKAADVVGRLRHYCFVCADHPVMGAPTLNIGTIRGGENINSVPDFCEVGVDIRTVPGLDHATLKAGMARALGPEVEMRMVNDMPPVWTEPEGAWVQRVFAISEEMLGERPAVETITAYTDAGSLTRAYGGAPAIVLGPGEPELAHMVNEHCLVSRTEQSVAIIRRIVQDWCGV
jgi:succinyl-diaminopimelate desuccinylase